MRTTAKVIASSAKANLDLIMRKSVWRKGRCSSAATTSRPRPRPRRVVIVVVRSLRRGGLVSSKSERPYGRLLLAIPRAPDLYAFIAMRMRRRPSDVGNDGSTSTFYEKVSEGFFFSKIKFLGKEFCLGIRIGNINH